jgi:hypothetical protein
MAPTLTYPTGGEYREALFNTRLCFKDPALVGATVTKDALGLPKPVSGAFASVFTVQNLDGRRWAVKCFTRFVNDQPVRYRRISEALRSVDKPWRVEFEYLTEGVFCRGTWYPALKMEWIEAKGLIPYIEAHLWDSNALAHLAAKFAQMVEDLSVLGIAHGDLQHGNLLVTPAGELKLIDYDGMYAPSLTQLGACEKGHVNYQSPARTMSSWGPYLDNFSAWIIYSSLIALAIDPGLWSILHNEGDETLIFHKDDYMDHRHSQALLGFAQSSQTGLPAVTRALSVLWTPDLRAIPPLNAAELPAPSIQHVTPPVSTASPTAATGSVPDWVLQSQTSAQSAPPGVQGDSSWMAGHLPPLPLVAFSPPRVGLRIVMALWLVATIVVGLSAVARVLSALLAASSALILVLAFIAVTIVMYRKTPEWRAKHERLIELKDHRANASEAARQVTRLGRTRSDVDVRERKEVERIAKEADKAKSSEQKELADLNTRLTAQVQKLEKQRQNLQSSESKEIGNALRMLQQQHVLSRLQAARIGSARISGIGTGIVSSLAACGITSAADFNGVHYEAGPRGGQQIFIRRRNGVPVHPRGVGDKKALALESWRKALEARAISTQPTSLPTGQAQSIKVKYAQQRQTLADAEKAARSRAANEQNQIRQNWVPKHSAISAKMVATRQAFAQERVEADRQLATAQKQSGAAEWRRQLAKREEAAYGNVRYRRYVAGVISSR